MYTLFLLCIIDKITLTYYAKQNRNNVLEQMFPTLESNVIEESSSPNTVKYAENVQSCRFNNLQEMM